MTIAKRQHYVWRHYLRPWADNESIWTYFKELGKIEKANLMRVAQEKYFYRLIDISDEDEEYLIKFIEQISPDSIIDLNFDFLRLFTIPKKLKQLFQTTISINDKKLFADEINELEINLMENAHGKTEALGLKLLTFRTIEDLKTLEENRYLFDTIMFLCFQYFRTKKIRESVLNSFKGGEFEKQAETTWNIISFTFATILARSISLDPKLKFIFINNRTTNHFITGDQTFFNISEKQTDVNKDEFYYPITPKHAIIIHFRDDQNNKFVDKDADEVMINDLNNKVVENSGFFVFASTKDQLLKFK